MPRRPATRHCLLLALLLSAGCGHDTITDPPITPVDPAGRLASVQQGLAPVSLLVAYTDAAGTQYVGGSVGILFSRVPGGPWQVQRVASTEFVLGIWGTSSGDLFVAVGSLLLQREGNNWLPVAIPGGGATLLSMKGIDDQHAWVTGTGGTILYLEGGEWKRAQVPVADEVWGIAALDASRLTAVGQNGVILESDDGGRTWSTVPSPTTATLFSVTADAGGRMVAVGADGTVLLRDGDTWERSVAPTTQALFEVTSEGGNSFLAAGNGGTLLRGNGITWQKVTVAGARENLRAITGAPGSRVAAGWNGTILDEKTGWGTSETSTRLYGVHVAPDGDAIAVGEGGVGFRRQQGGWQPIAIPSPATLLAIDGPSATDRIAVGDSGAVLHFDGNAWQVEATPGVGVLRSVWYDGQHALVVGAGGFAMVREGGAWRALPTATTRYLRDIGGNSWNRLWVVGDSGTAMFFDGSVLHPIGVGSDQNLRGAWERSPNDAWIVGDFGTVLHSDGRGWTKQFPPALNHIRAVRGIGQHVYVVGELGLAYRLTDGEWTAMANDELGFWLDLGGRDELVAVGEAATIGEGRP